MKIVDQSHEIIEGLDDIQNLPKLIEAAGRTCYKSEDKITNTSADAFCKKLIKNGHHAMLEHGIILAESYTHRYFMVRFITDRGVTHELVRHRNCAFAQESTRFVKYDGDMEFIRPVFDWADINLRKTSTSDICLPIFQKRYAWEYLIRQSEETYQTMIKYGAPPQEARSVLPNSLKTEIVVTANIEEWHHIMTLRTAASAHPQIRELMLRLLKEFQGITPLFTTLKGEK
jgi:thymidylate synthase (FAD)